WWLVPGADATTSRYELVDPPAAVAIVAVRYEPAGEREPHPRPCVALVRQHRPAIGRDMLEVPAGLVEQDEDEHPERTAVRELREETGFQASDWRCRNPPCPPPRLTRPES